jgi:hypothetical protein
VSLTLLSLLVTAGCTNASGVDLCTQYDALSTEAAELREMQPAATSADEIRAQVEAVQVALDRLQAVSEGQLDQAISNLRAAASELAQSAVSTGREALDDALPALKESVERVRETWAVLEQVAQNQCT